MKKQLHELNREEYESLLHSGMFWVIYPEATGIMSKDLNFDLRDLYLADLAKDVYYTKKPKPRVRHIANWERIQSHARSGDFRTITEEDTVWCWSDTHFSHKNIIKFSDRPFPNTTLMNECLITAYQNVVKDTDICIWGGDVTFGSTSEVNIILNQLPGYKILIVGNHDIRKGKVRNLDFDEIHLLYEFQREGINYVWTHYPFENLPVPHVNIHGHIHQRTHKDLLKINTSVEAIGYKPVLFDDIHAQAKTRLHSMER